MIINFWKWEIFHYCRFKFVKKDLEVCLFSLIFLSWDFNKKTNEKKWHFGGFNFHRIIPNQNMIRGKKYGIFEIEFR